MSTTLGTLLTSHAFTTAGAAAAVTARAAYEATQPATASLGTSRPLLAVVGDMVSAPDAAQRDQEEGSPIASRFLDVSNMVVGSNCTYFCCLGDNVYDNGQLVDYQGAYTDTFGRVNAKCLPLPGNHEYQTANAADYYTYFGNRAGPPLQGWYAANIANWRYYALNSNAAAYVASGSAQMTWLLADFAAHASAPKVVAMHHPRWTDGGTSVTDDNNYDYLWQQMYAQGHVQIMLGGHDHNYQRWDTVRSNGTSANPVTVSDGITQFVVGSGGNNFYDLVPARHTGGAGNTGRCTYGHDRAFGVLFLRLGPSTWDWSFNCVDGTVYDSGTRSIH